MICDALMAYISWRLIDNETTTNKLHFIYRSTPSSAGRASS